MSKKFELPVTVYYEDTDAGGVVYHANYLKFAERARTEALNELGFTNTQLVQDMETLIVVRHVEIDHFKPARLEDKLIVSTTLPHVGNSSFQMTQLVCDASSGETLTQIHITLVCVNLDGKAIRIPEILKEAFSECVEAE